MLSMQGGDRRPYNGRVGPQRRTQHDTMDDAMISNESLSLPPQQCAHCGEPVGDGDWEGRPWGLIEEPGPSGVPVVHAVHAPCYLYRSRTQPGSRAVRFRIVPSRSK